MSKKHTITVVAYPDRGAGNDPKLFFFFFFGGGGSLSPPRLNIFTVDNMEVMICLGQGGLRSLSASSFNHIFLQDNGEGNHLFFFGEFLANVGHLGKVLR